MRVLYQIFVHVAYVRACSVLVRHVDDRPHRLSAGRDDRSTQRGRNVIYDCLIFCFFLFCLEYLAIVMLGTAVNQILQSENNRLTIRGFTSMGLCSAPT